MSLYRQAGGRGPGLLAAILVAGLLIGAAAGFFAGRATSDQPSLAEQAAEARAELEPVAAGIELVPIEYEGERAAAAAATARAAADLEASAADLRTLDPEGYEAAADSVTALATAVEAAAPPAQVKRLASAASAEVEALAGS